MKTIQPLARVFRPMSLAVLFAATLLSGCSTTAMKTTPIWDREYTKGVGPVEDRVNLWPVFYYRNPAWSALWPLVSVTDEGSAFVPFYEYDKTTRELRLLYAHQALPAAAVVNKKNQYTRVLNTIYDGKNEEFDILPLYFQDFKDKELLILPVFYKNKKAIWTPLYSHSPHLTGVLGPLFNVYHDGLTETWNLPFPLVGVRSGVDRRGFWALPAVYYDREGKATHLNLGAVLFDSIKDAGETKIHYAAFLGGWDRKTNGDAHSYLLPLYGAWREGGKSGFVSLPWTKIEEGDRSLTVALFNAWVESRRGDDLHQGVCWPLFMRFRNPERGGHAILPIYYYEKAKDGGVTFFSFPFNYKSDGRLVNVLGPLYIRTHDERGTYATACWPFAHAWDRTDGKGSALLPFYYLNNTPDGGRLLATPLGGTSKSKDGEFLDIGGPLWVSSKSAKDGSAYRAVAWPFWHEWTEKAETSKLLLPVFYYKQGAAGSEFWSLPLSLGRDRDRKSHFMNIGGLLFGREVNAARTETWMLANLIGWTDEVTRERFAWHAFPLAAYDDAPDYRETSILLGSHYRAKIDEAEARRELLSGTDRTGSPQHLEYPTRQLLDRRRALLFVFHSSRSLVRTVAPLKPGEAAGADAVEVSDARRGRLKATVRKESEIRLFPLYAATETEGVGGEASLLWRLYDSRSKVNADGSVYERQRVLWRIVHREAEGGRVSVDVFPFITWDRNGADRKFTFAGGLLGGGVKAGKGYTQVFYMKF